jgi:hypothetical protein
MLTHVGHMATLTRCCTKDCRVGIEREDFTLSCCKCAPLVCGRCWVRTSDLCRVKAGAWVHSCSLAFKNSCKQTDYLAIVLRRTSPYSPALVYYWCTDNVYRLLQLEAKTAPAGEDASSLITRTNRDILPGQLGTLPHDSGTPPLVGSSREAIDPRRGEEVKNEAHHVDSYSARTHGARQQMAT